MSTRSGLPSGNSEGRFHRAEPRLSRGRQRGQAPARYTPIVLLGPFRGT